MDTTMRWRLLLAAVLALTACGGETGSTSSGGASGGDPNNGGAGGSDEGGNHQGGAPQGGSGGLGGGCANSLTPDGEAPLLLSDTGLYADGSGLVIRDTSRQFTPQYELWSDGATKARWIYLPECDPIIDNQDENDWSFPVGTRWWKEFSVGGRRIETRLIERIGEGAQDFLFTSYLWNEAETDAERVPNGVMNALGTTHDVPSEDTCRRCHGSHLTGGGRPSRALGFSALQLAHDGEGVTLGSLVADGHLLNVPAMLVERAPGTPTERAALGTLHANCGHCHNSTADRVAQVNLNLWLDVGVATPEGTLAYQTTVGVMNTIFNDPTVTARIEPGEVEKSSVWFRMGQRNNNAQMPPAGSEVIDAASRAAVAAWIASLP